MLKKNPKKGRKDLNLENNHETDLHFKHFTLKIPCLNEDCKFSIILKFELQGKFSNFQTK